MQLIRVIKEEEQVRSQTGHTKIFFVSFKIKQEADQKAELWQERMCNNNIWDEGRIKKLLWQHFSQLQHTDRDRKRKKHLQLCCGCCCLLALTSLMDEFKHELYIRYWHWTFVLEGRARPKWLTCGLMPMTLSTLPPGWFSLKGHFTNNKPALIHYIIGTIIQRKWLSFPFSLARAFFFIMKISSDYEKFIILVLTYPFNYPHFPSYESTNPYFCIL